MRYKVLLSKTARKDIEELRTFGVVVPLRKIKKLLDELELHPTRGTGKPKQLKGDRAGQWRRRITSKHRMVYTIKGNELLVLVLITSSHYGDK